MIEHCEFSIYGKSLVDMYLYIGDSGGTVKSAVIKMLEDNDDGAMAQSKRKQELCSMNYEQINGAQTQKLASTS